MERLELQRVKSALLHELDVTLQRCCHQGIQELMTDLRIHYTSVKPDSSPDEIFSIVLDSGVLKTISARPLLPFRESLERLRKGTFGRCAICGGEIPAAHLEHDPTTTRCAACDRDSRKLTQKPDW